MTAVGLLGSVVGLFVFAIPALTAAGAFPGVRFVLGVLVVLVALVSPAYPWLYETSVAALGRWREYSRLYQRAEVAVARLAELRERAAELLRFVTAASEEQGEKERFSALAQAVLSFGRDADTGSVLEMTKATYEGSEVVIALRKRPGRMLVQGDVVAVVHTDDGFVMGRFTVSEERPEEYYAAGRAEDVDPLWRGRIVDKGEATMFPKMVAILVRKEVPL